MIYGFVYENGPTNVRKLSKGVSVPCRAPSLRPGGGPLTPYLRNIGQIFDLEVHCMPFIIKFPISSDISKQPKNLRVVEGFLESIISVRINRL